MVPLVGTLLAACRVGLPPEPPGADPADANASTPPYQAQPNPYETSAFAGEPPATSTGHEHMNHGAMTGHEGMGHGSGPGSGAKPVTPVMPPNTPPEPLR